MEPHSKNVCRRNSCKGREWQALGGLLMQWNKRDSRGNGQVNFLPAVLALLESQVNILMTTSVLFAILLLDPGLVLDYCLFIAASLQSFCIKPLLLFLVLVPHASATLSMICISLCDNFQGSCNVIRVNAEVCGREK